MRSRLLVSVLGSLALAACGGSDSDGVPTYLATDSCSGHTDEASCTADTAHACAWLAVGAPASDGTPAIDGVCAAPDPCRDHSDEASCAADVEAGCAWAAVELCPPPGDDCPAGFCYGAADAPCACTCPMYCPEGGECPPCDCDCSGGGGGTCTCECPPCAPGETCEPCTCDCAGGGCTDEGTCTCVCPECPDGVDCPPCDCGCEDSAGETGTSTCECPPCAPGETCAPCDCGAPDDPCAAYAEEAACLADTANECVWYAIGAPCMEGMPCVSGVCQSSTIGGGGGMGGGMGGCACVCPDCPPGTECPPCSCGGSGSSEPGGAEPGGTP